MGKGGTAAHEKRYITKEGVKLVMGYIVCWSTWRIVKWMQDGESSLCYTLAKPGRMVKAQTMSYGVDTGIYMLAFMES